MERKKNIDFLTFSLFSLASLKRLFHQSPSILKLRKFTSILSTHLRLGVASNLFPQVQSLLLKNLYDPLLSQPSTPSTSTYWITRFRFCRVETFDLIGTTHKFISTFILPHQISTPLWRFKLLSISIFFISPEDFMN